MKSREKIIALFGISLLSFTGFLDATIVSTALPVMQNNLHMTVTELQWVMNAFFLGISAFMASMGRVADMYGRRKVFYLGIFIFGCASLGAGLSNHAIPLICFRAIQGITVAITIPVGIALIHTLFNKEQAAKAMGFFGAVTGTGLAIGPVVGGALITKLGWPYVFFINIPFIIIGLSMCIPILAESKSKIRMELDYYGIIFLIMSIGALVFATVEANNFGWNSPMIIASFSLAFIAMILLIISEKKAKNPIIEGGLFKNKTFLASTLFSFLGGGIMSVILFINPLYLDLIGNKSSMMTGLLLFIMPFVVMSSSPIIGQMNQKFGPLKLMFLGTIFYAIAAIGEVFFSLQLNYMLLIPTFVIFGLGWSIVNQSPAVAIGQSVEEDHLSVAMGILFSFYNIGAAIILALSVNLFHQHALKNLSDNLFNKGFIVHADQQKLLAQFVSQPNQMYHIIQQLKLSTITTVDIFKEAFVTGMHTMFYPLIILVFISIIALYIALLSSSLRK